MKKAKTNLIDIDRFRSLEREGILVGRIVSIDDCGRPFVDYPGNVLGALNARSIMTEPFQGNSSIDGSHPVLLVFENKDPALPIIIGVVRETLYQDDTAEAAVPEIEKDKEVLLDGKRMAFEAREEIELRCGKSSVVLTKQGKIVLKGVEIVSRASRTNKIKGSMVKIN